MLTTKSVARFNKSKKNIPLNSDQLAEISVRYEKLVRDFEDNLIEDIARRIAKAGEITSTAEWQIRRLKEIDYATEYIEKQLAIFTQKSEQEIEWLFFEAAQVSDDFYKEVYAAAGKPFVPLEDNPYLQQYVNAGIAQTKADIDEQKKVIGDGLSEILKIHQEAYKKLEEARSSYQNKLMSVGGSLFSVEETTDATGKKVKKYTVNNIKEQLARMRSLHEYIKKLKERGVSDELLKELISQNDEDALQFAKYMASMNEGEFKQINSAYTQKTELAKSLADDLYKNEAQKLSDAFDEELSNFSAEASKYGALSAEEFINAWDEAMKSKGLNKFSSQLEAAGANRSESNYVTIEKGVKEMSAPRVMVQQPVTLMLDNTALGKANIRFQIDYDNRTGG